MTQAANVVLDGSHALATGFVDLDSDGWPDLAVAGDFGTSRLYWNEGDGNFANGTATAGVGTDENAMGSTIGDFDGDGDFDWFVTSIYDPLQRCQQRPGREDASDPPSCYWGNTGNRLYRNEGGRVFSDATEIAGVRDGSWGWGAAFYDYENDGHLDLVMSNGVDYP